jgi:hypothetical protein
LKLYILIAILLIVGCSDATTLKVCSSGCDYSSIQTAIKYADPGDTINVSAGSYKENIMTTKPIAIEGAGMAQTIIEGSFAGPVFTIGPGLNRFGPGPTVSLSKMTIEQGRADSGGGIFNQGGIITLTLCNITNNTANDYGGGAYNSLNGTIVLNSSSMNNNRATYPRSGSGGGIYNEYGTVSIDANSTIINNTAVYSGGGISSHGTLNLYGSIISGNRAAIGGGIYNEHAEINMYSGSISNNTANMGGGIFNDQSQDATAWALNLDGGSIDGNYAETYGGGIYNNQGWINLNGSSIEHNYVRLFNGGGIYNNLGLLDLNGSSIDYNYAGTYGGGIYNNVDASSGLYSTVNLINGSVRNNTANAKFSGGGIYSVYGTVIAGNRSLVLGNAPDQIRTVES